MPDLNLVAVLVSAVAAFIAAGAYYAVVGNELADVSDAAAAGGSMHPWEIAVELVRCLVVAAVVAGLASQGGVDEWTGGLILGTVLWIGFPLVLWTGAIVHEKAHWKLAAIHAGDWLVKLLIVALIVSTWQ